MNTTDTPTTDSLHTVLSALENALPTGVACGGQRISATDVSKVPAELIPRNAVADRKIEFAAGRLAAACATKKLGLASNFPAIGQNREPVWAPGIVGSITHNGEFALAATARNAYFEGIGIDLEQNISLAAEIQNQIIGEPERLAWQSMPGGPPLNWQLSVFSIKEAVFKCVFPTSAIWFDFLDVEIRIVGNNLQALCVDSSHALAKIVSRCKITLQLVDNYQLVACWLAAECSTTESDFV